MKDFIRKVTSRKFLFALAAFVAGLIVALGGTEETAEKVSGLIVSAAAAIAYITGESCVDAASASGGQKYYTLQFPKITDEDAQAGDNTDDTMIYTGTHERESETKPEEEPPDEEEDDF